MKGPAWWVWALLGLTAGVVLVLRARPPRLVVPGPVVPCDPVHAAWRDTGERLEPGRVYRLRRQVLLPLPRDGQLTGECVLAPAGWLVAVQRGLWDPWGWASVAPGELGVSGLPPWWTTRALVYGRGGPSYRVQATLIRTDALELG